MEDFDFVCISLTTRTDRQEKSKQLFKKLGILNRIHWWIVEKHPQGGMYGCFESHWSVWTCSEFTRPYICIFEDDLCEVGPDSIWRFYQAMNYTREMIPSRLDILNLEPSLGYVEKPIKDDVYEGGFLHLGCYMTHRSILPMIAKRTIDWFGIDIDTALYKNCRMGGVLPPVFQQRSGPSDNGGGFRNIGLPLESVFNRLTSHNQEVPVIGWLSIELAQFLSLYYLATRSKPLEFKDRRAARRI